jgi:leukotriene-A4 hydrolase
LADHHCSEEAIEEYGENHEFTKLCISHKGIDPDDAFSTVPYEKGFHFIYYLDRLVGRENFDKFIPHYFGKWANKSLDSYEFKDTFLEFFSAPEYAGLKDKISEIDWEGRFFNTGLPPKPEFNTSLVDTCYELAEKWKQKDFSPNPSDISSWTGNQVLVFLNTVRDFEKPLTAEQSVSLSVTGESPLICLLVCLRLPHHSNFLERYTVFWALRTPNSRRHTSKSQWLPKIAAPTRLWQSYSGRSGV